MEIIVENEVSLRETLRNFFKELQAIQANKAIQYVLQKWAREVNMYHRS